MARYFISYAHGDGVRGGFGNVDVSLTQPIRTSDDFKFVVDHLHGQGLQGVTVLGWQRFEEPS